MLSLNILAFQRIFFKVLWVFVLLNQASCQSTKNSVIPSFELELQKTWSLKNADKIFPQEIKYKENFLWIYNQFKQKIYQYDLYNQKLIQEIVLNDYLPRKFVKMVIQSYYPINKDSLLLILNGGNDPFYHHDSLIIMIHLQNKTYRHLSIDSLPVTCIKNPSRKDNHYWFLLSSNSSLLLQKNQFLFPLKHFGGELGDTVWNENKDKNNLFIYDIEKQKVVKNISFEFPSKLGEYYPRDYSKHSTCWINENLIGIAFQHTSTVYLYDLKNSQSKHLNFKSYLIEKIPYSSEYVHYIQRKNDDIKLARYKAIGYHPQLNCLYRLVRHPAPHENYQNSVYSLLLFDLKTHQIYENILPNHINLYNLIPYKNGFIVFDEKNSNIQEGKWIFSYYEIKPIQKKREELQLAIDSLYKVYEIPDDFKKYWKEVFRKPIEEGNYLLIPVETSCMPCLEGLLKKLENEKAKWCNSNLKIIIISTPSILEEKYKSINMEVPKDCYLFDFNKNLLKYMKSFINFRLITVDENEQIIDDRILNPKDLPLIEKLLNSLQTK